MKKSKKYICIIIILAILFSFSYILMQNRINYWINGVSSFNKSNSHIMEITISDINATIDLTSNKEQEIFKNDQLTIYVLVNKNSENITMDVYSVGNNTFESACYIEKRITKSMLLIHNLILLGPSFLLVHLQRTEIY